jgi:hypothetical protein
VLGKERVTERPVRVAAGGILDCAFVGPDAAVLGDQRLTDGLVFVGAAQGDKREHRRAGDRCDGAGPHENGANRGKPT